MSGNDRSFHSIADIVFAAWNRSAALEKGKFVYYVNADVTRLDVRTRTWTALAGIEKQVAIEVKNPAFVGIHKLGKLGLIFWTPDTGKTYTDYSEVEKIFSESAVFKSKFILRTFVIHYVLQNSARACA
jgi:hypothetical protein